MKKEMAKTFLPAKVFFKDSSWVGLFLLLFSACDSQVLSKKTETPLGKTGNLFFVYDAVDHYAAHYGDMDMDLYAKQSSTKQELEKSGVVLGDLPYTISDTFIVANLPGLGYTKKAVDSNSFSALNAVFQEKAPSFSTASSCINVFNDIIVLINQHKIVGIVKICFGCHAVRFTGTTANTSNFGTDEDYTKLHKLLYGSQ